MVPPFGPIETRSGELPPRLPNPLQIDTELLQPWLAGSGYDELPVATREDAAIYQSVGQTDSQLASQVVITGAGTADGRKPRTMYWPLGMLRRDRREGLYRMGHVGVCDAVIAVPALRFERQQPSVHEPREVAAGSLRRDPGDTREFASCERPPVKQRREHGSPRSVTYEAPHGCQGAVRGQWARVRHCHAHIVRQRGPTSFRSWPKRSSRPCGSCCGSCPAA